MEERVPNSVSGDTLPTNRICYQWMMENGKASKRLDLGEFDWALRAHTLFQKDVDPIMDFLRSIAEKFKTPTLALKYYNDEVPYVEFSGRGQPTTGEGFPNTKVSIGLSFMMPHPTMVTLGAIATSYPILLDLEEHEGRDEYLAWEKALSQLSYDTRTSSNNNQIQRIHGEDRNLYFKAETSQEDRTQSGAPNLTTIYRRTLDLAGAVQQSYSATKMMKDMRNQKISGLAQKMTRAS